MANTTNSYYALIQKAISDFDAIFGAMAKKGVKYDGKLLGTTGAGIADGISTETYSTLIGNQLFVIEGLTDTAGTKKISNYSATATTGTATIDSKTVDGDATVYNATVNPGAEGYYTTGSEISITLAAEDISLAGSSTTSGFNLVAGTNGSLGNYYYGGSGNVYKIISSVTVAQGKVTNTYAENAMTDTREYTSTVAFGESTIDYVTTVPTGTTKEYIAIPFTKTINKSAGTLTVTPTKNVSEGYVKDGDVTLSEYTKTFEATSVTSSDTESIYIPKGSITNIVSTPTEGNQNVGKIQTSAKTLDTTGLTAEQIAEQGISVSTIAGSVNISGTFGEGYVSGGTDVSLGNIQMSADEIYLERTTLPSTASITSTITATTDVGSVLNTNSEGYKITLTSAGSTTASVEEGYIANSTITVNSSGTTDIYVKKGSYEVNPSATVSLVSGSIATESATAADDYEITVNPVIADITKTDAQFTEGYIKTANITNGTKTQSGSTYYIAHGSATILNGLTTEYKAGSTDDGDGTKLEGGNIVDIFVTENQLDTTRDYYEITSSATKTVTPGYVIDSDIEIGAVAKKYLPKALVQWVTAVDGGEEFLQITKGGYLPAGAISDITKVEMSAASIGLTVDGTSDVATDNQAIFTTTVLGEDAGYKLVVGKNGSTTNAGYVSATQGTLTGDIYIAKGGVSAATTVGTLSAGDVTKGSDGEGEAVRTIYTVSVSGRATTAITTTRGYITSSEVKLNGNLYSAANNQVDIATTVTMEQAALSYKENAIVLGLDPVNTIETATSSKYSIAPTISGTVSIDTTSAGYTAVGDVTTVSLATSQISDESKAPIYLKVGTGATLNVVNSTVAPTANFSDDVAKDGSYTISVGGNVNVTGTIATGYYGSTESAITQQTKSITGGSITVDRASVSSTTTATTAVSADIIKFVTTTETGKQYASVTSDIASLSTTVSADKDGYVKTTEVSSEASHTNNSAATASQTKYIDLVRLTTNEDEVSGTENPVLYVQTIGATTEIELASAGNAAYQTLTLDTDDKYSRYDTKITLGSHAMGTAVINEFDILAQRLAGTYQSSTT